MSTSAHSQQLEGEARTGIPQKDVKSRRRSVMDIFHDSFHHTSASGRHGSDLFPSHDITLDPEPSELSTDLSPDQVDGVVSHTNGKKPQLQSSSTVDKRKEAANPWGSIFKNREHFVEIHFR